MSFQIIESPTALLTPKLNSLVILIRILLYVNLLWFMLEMAEDGGIGGTVKRRERCNPV